MTYSLGIDIGGTKIASGLIDENGRCIFRAEVPSIKTDREVMFDQVILCIEQLLQRSQVSVEALTGIGLGVAGKVDIENGIAIYQNNLPWENFPLVDRIKERFSVENVVMDNDVYMATFAEWKTCGGIIGETFVYLTISTGISCCTIHNGDFIRGTGFAGEVGFLPVDEKGQRLEEAASGPGIERLANAHFSAVDENGVQHTAKQVLEGFKSGDPESIKIMAKPLDVLAKLIYAIACLLDPDKIILGGGVMNHNPELLVPIKKSLKRYLVPEQAAFLNRMQFSQLKGDAGLIGAGMKAFSAFA